MNDKTFKIARLIRLAIFLGILFSFAWMFRYDVQIHNGGDSSIARSWIKHNRWTGNVTTCTYLGRDYFGDGCGALETIFEEEE
jgi:hypothetical protein